MTTLTQTLPPHLLNKLYSDAIRMANEDAGDNFIFKHVGLWPQVDDQHRLFCLTITVDNISLFQATIMGLGVATAAYRGVMSYLFTLPLDPEIIHGHVQVLRDGLWEVWERTNDRGETETMDDLAFGFAELLGGDNEQQPEHVD